MNLPKMKKSLFLISMLLVFAGTQIWRSHFPMQNSIRIRKATLYSTPPIQDPVCKEQYLALFRNPELKILIAFGYKDARPARFVADRYERSLVASALSGPCNQNQSSSLCEFVRSHDDSDLFEKQIIGPDGLRKKIRITLVNSSVSPDDNDNRKNPLQNWQSTYSKTKFLEALRNSQVVFYNGHSRGGGGPDFQPPRVNESNMHVNYSWYRSHEPGLPPMLEGVSNSKDLKVLGLFSCASDKLFSDRIFEKNEQITLISSDKLIYFSDALEVMLKSLTHILETTCYPELIQSIQTLSPESGIHLTR